MFCYRFKTDFGGSKGVAFVYHSPHIYEYLAIACLLSLYIIIVIFFKKKFNGKYLATVICLGLAIVVFKSQYICNIHEDFISRYLVLEFFMFWPLSFAALFWSIADLFGKRVEKTALIITFISPVIIYFTSTILL